MIETKEERELLERIVSRIYSGQLTTISDLDIARSILVLIKEAGYVKLTEDEMSPIRGNKMRKINKGLEEQRRKYKWQFGKEQPFTNDRCRLCGKPFGLHYGDNCPVISLVVEEKDEN